MLVSSKQGAIQCIRQRSSIRSQVQVSFQRLWLVPLLIFLSVGQLSAESTTNEHEPQPGPVVPLELSVVDNMQWQGNDSRVIGLRLSMFSAKNYSLYGLDLGLANRITKNSGGLRLAIYNGTDGGHTGLEVGVANVSSESLGLQLGFFNGTDSLIGYQIGAINYLDGPAFLPMTGALANVSENAYFGQLTLGINVSDYSPVQIAGLGNIQSQESVPLQLALGFNFGDQNLLQISGLYNQGDDENLLQITTGVNFAGNIPVQFGLLGNAADDVGLQIGALNFGDDTGLQFGLGNNAQSIPLQVAVILNSADENPLQLSGLVNYGRDLRFQVAGLYNEADYSLFQLSLLGNSSEQGYFQLTLGINGDGVPVQIGSINLSDESKFQLGVYNQSRKNHGFRLGLINRSEEHTGLDIGLFNETHTLNGHQIGLINIAWKGRFPFTILYNYGDQDIEEIRTGLLKAGWTPLQLSHYMPGQLFEKEVPVYGLRLNFLYSENRRVYGLDFGILQFSDAGGGIQLGVFNEVAGDHCGLQAGIVQSVARGNGIYLAGLFQEMEELNGFSLAPIAITEGPMNGYQLGLIYNRATKFPVLQVGGWNDADEADLQLGWIGNQRETGSAAPQIGLLFNISEVGAVFQLSGLLNHTEDYSFLQLSGIVNASDELSFLQLTGGVNTTHRNLMLQLAGLGNISDGPAPLQLAGIWNSAETATYLQMAGFVNLGPQPISDEEIRISSPLAQISLIHNQGFEVPLQVSVVNYARESAWFQIGGFNFADRPLFQLGLINAREIAPGIQIGLANGGSGLMAQFGLINVGTEDGTAGIMVAPWNYAHQHSGLMLGVFNYAEDLTGIQIGLINVNRSGTFSIMPGLNF